MPTDNAKCAVEMVKQLIEGGADVRVVNKDGNCPLPLAALREDVPLVEELLQGGGDYSVADKNEWHLAPSRLRTHGNPDMARLILPATPTTLNCTHPTGPNTGD